jgi:hypothetical protein
MLDVHVGTLWQWEKQCDFLGGAGLEKRKLKGFLGRRHTFYTLRCLNRVLANRSSMPPVPDYPGFVYVPDALEELQISLRTLFRRLKKYKETTHDKKAKIRTGRISIRAFVRQQFIDKVKAESERQNRPDELAFAEAAAMLGLNMYALEDIVHRGKLQAIRRGKKNNGRCTSRRIPRAAVEKFLRERMGPTIAEEQTTETPGVPIPQPEPTPSRRGPKRSNRTIELGQFCYQQLLAEVKRRVICRMVSERFNRTMTHAQVTVYASRYAKDKSLPWPLN